MPRQTSRRRFLTVTVGALAGLNVTVLAQDEDDREFILLGGTVEGWQPYRLPRDTSTEEAEVNPTLTLKAETTYTLLWTNLDGQPHNFAIRDADGENLQTLQVLEVKPETFEELNETTGGRTVSSENVTVDNEIVASVTTVSEDELVGSTDNVGEEGAVQAVRFTATEEMAQYTCEAHPNTMGGDIELAEADDEDGNGDGGGY